MQSSPPGRLRDRQAELGEADLRLGAGAGCSGASGGRGETSLLGLPTQWNKGPVRPAFGHPAMLGLAYQPLPTGSPAPPGNLDRHGPFIGADHPAQSGEDATCREPWMPPFTGTNGALGICGEASSRSKLGPGPRV